MGHYVPSKVVTNDDLAKMIDTSDEWIQQRTGIKERRYIEEDGIGASDLAVPAVQMACKNAGIEVSDIDAIIFATLSPDHAFPGSGVFLGDKLDLGEVLLVDTVAGMRDAIRKFAIVGDQQQTFGLQVEPPDRGRAAPPERARP